MQFNYKINMIVIRYNSYQNVCLITVTRRIIHDHSFNYTGPSFSVSFHKRKCNTILMLLIGSLVKSGTAAPPTTRLNRLFLFRMQLKVQRRLSGVNK